MTNDNKFPIRTELTVLPADKATRFLHPILINARGKTRDRRRIGFTVKETIGMAIINPRALKALTKPVIVGK